MYRSIVIAVVVAVSGCATSSKQGAASAPVLELAVRQVPGAGAEFASARDAFVGRLRAQPGVVADHELQAIFDLGVMGPPATPVFTGMTQYESLDAFKAAGAALGTAPEARAFFATFKPVVFTVLRPLDSATSVDLAKMVKPGQVLELAVRDLSKYDTFDAAAYARARDAFLALLARQPGVVAEYQWVSALDPNLVVGMTVYESAEAFQRVAAGPVMGAPETKAFFAWPPTHGFVHSVVR
ncbi:MAG: hypothetical protein SFW67_23765 [Myxococcaceae bacterium]|nr:hypothetical protein [Myxococcaceae bacterium]